MDKPNKFIIALVVAILYPILFVIESSLVYYFFGRIFGSVSLSESVEHIFISSLYFFAWFGGLFGIVVVQGITILGSYGIQKLDKKSIRLSGIWLIVFSLLFSWFPNFFVFWMLSMLPIAWVSLVGYRNYFELIHKLIFPSLIIFLIAIPAITLLQNWNEVYVKTTLGMLDRPTYLPSEMGMIEEKVGEASVKWDYYCESYRNGLARSGSFWIDQKKLGHKYNDGTSVSLENLLKDYREYNRELEEVDVNGYTGYYYHSEVEGAFAFGESSFDTALYWSTDKVVIEMRGFCDYLNKSEMLKIAESMK